jgi:hypothetical protein
VTIQWTAAAVDAGSTISLAYDTTTDWGNPKWVEIDEVSAADGAALYTWNVTGISPGTYYLAGYLNDAAAERKPPLGKPAGQARTRPLSSNRRFVLSLQ